GSGDLVLYNSYEDKLGILTANATTPYVIGFIDLAKTGPMVIESPAGPIAAGTSDMWQRSISDIGETGPDQGKGGKYLLMPPGQKAPADTSGYYVVEMPMMNSFVGLRILDPDPAKGKALVEQLRIYPYEKRADPPATRLVSPNGREWSGTQPRKLAYWQRLHAILQEEPVAERDRFFMAMLANLGIEKDKPFAPTEAQKKLLIEGAKAGELMAQVNSFAKRFPGSVWWPDRRWELVLNIEDPSQRVQNYDQLLERTAWFYEAVTNSKGMISKTPGFGQAYLGAYTDAKGQWLDGGKSYRLRVPADPPAKQFWSVTLYDVGTRCFVDNAQRKADLSSRQDLTKNPDGSVDLFFGPKAPKGQEANWVQTVPGKHWFAYMRFYGPTEAYFDKSWKLGDIEVTK
ncbi:MAG: DUF1254 domain-containing protein, partial [Rhodospirillales bacterium]|nr:DUF1254 domain-containing protein [Rhodospirillales bacterium]